MLLPYRTEYFCIGFRCDLRIGVWLVRVAVDDRCTGIEASIDLGRLFLNGLRGERVRGLGRRPVDGALENDRGVVHCSFRRRRCGGFCIGGELLY